MAEWIDTHCHLETFAQKGSLPTILERAEAAGVRQLISIGTSPGDWIPYRALAANYPARIFWTAGLHPGHVDENWQSALEQLPGTLDSNPSPVAVGEIGLDYFRLPKDQGIAEKLRQWQGEAFRQQLALARERDLPVVVHSRAAFAECLAVIDESGFPAERVVFHCFADGPQEISAINQRGGRGSFTGLITFKNAQSIREAAAKQGLDRLMLETDSPYLAPEPHRGKACEPAMLVHSGERAAEVLEVSVEELAQQSTANARAFFRLPACD